MARKPRIVLPDKIFHKLWSCALNSDNFNSYFNMVTDKDSSNYINLSKYDFDIDLAYDALRCIYDFSNITISDILKEHGFTNATFSHRFCIPISTVECWVTGKRECPAYLKLLILESLGVTILPNKIILESRIGSAPIRKFKEIIMEKEQESTETSVDIENESDEDFEKRLDSLYNFSLKDWEQNHLTGRSPVMDDTDYLSKIIHRKDKE